MSLFFARSAILITALLFFGAGDGFGQTQTERDRRSTSVEDEMPKSVRENLAKHRIEQEKKEFEELLKRSEDAVRLSSELESKFSKSGSLGNEDQKKLDQLEKLVKKIRGDLGGSDDADDEETAVGVKPDEKPDSLVAAFKSLQSTASKLFDEVRKSTRYSVSVAAIRSSNVLLKVLKFIRFNK